jgi:hypothetical protein
MDVRRGHPAYNRALHSDNVSHILAKIKERRFLPRLKAGGFRAAFSVTGESRGL